ncbi:PD-(D/E)XK nuclease-like domain-containing protein [Gayadomonas joobiniege]|uniref:PD-(D/E)XK nuclease-like domain-containing protein n=1 Tax=Gayadomonas joobiniege TaxID=1234606 RepID=UPI0003646ACD|nr:PD-(D/E)XK nuclease-like domain-containing protein [Gayadomonas joobiniege]
MLDLNNPQPGIYFDVSDIDYHKSNAISKSTLDLVDKSAALAKWQQSAPVDDENSDSLDFGKAFHCALLEPERYAKEYITEPKLDRRTKEGKAKAAEFAESAKGKVIVTHDEARKIKLMVGSVMAHPDAAAILGLDGGVTEASIFWKDPETGLMCRIRPDWMNEQHNIILDVKTCGDIEGSFKSFIGSVSEYGYHKQDSYYTDGYEAHFGKKPLFVFLVVSTSIECGRYPVRVFMLDEQDKHDGRSEYRLSLNKYAHHLKSGNWHEIETIERPAWARKKTEQKLSLAEVA